MRSEHSNNSKYSKNMNNSSIEIEKIVYLQGKRKIAMVNQEELESSSSHQSIDEQVALLKEWFVIFMAVNCLNFLSIISRL